MPDPNMGEQNGKQMVSLGVEEGPELGGGRGGVGVRESKMASDEPHCRWWGFHLGCG